MDNLQLKSQDQLKKELSAPLPDDAISQHPTKTYLSSIKAIYVTERLNDVFGIGKWSLKVRSEKEGEKGMIVVHTTLEIPEYGMYYESFGGNDNGGETNKNFDLGDAYKGATTDAITKICSYLGIGIAVFKGLQKGKAAPKTNAPANTGTRTTPPPVQYGPEILKEILACKTPPEIVKLWDKYPSLQNDENFKAKMAEQRTAVNTPKA